MKKHRLIILLMLLIISTGNVWAVGLRWGQWLGGRGGGSTQISAVVYNANSSSLVLGGDLGVDGILLETGTPYGNYSGSNEGFVMEIAEGGTPSLQWAQLLGGTGTDLVSVLAVSGSSIYAGGRSSTTVNFETVTFQGTHTGSNEIFVIKILDGGTPSLVWGQWLGGSGSNIITGLAADGTFVYVGGYAQISTSFETVTFQGVSGGSTEGFVVEILDGGTPTLIWGQWLGGSNSDFVEALAVNGSSIYAAGRSLQSTGFETVTFQGVHSGSNEGFVVKITDGGTPTLNWGQWLGGSGGDFLTALAVNGGSIYAGGYSSLSTSFETLTFQGIFSPGTSEGFVVEIVDGGTPCVTWGQRLGGSSADEVSSIAVNGSSIYVGGYSSQSTSWETLTFQGIHSGSSEGFVVEIIDGGTPTLVWGQWIGGAGNDKVLSLAFNGSTIYAAGFTPQSTTWETITFHGLRTAGQQGFVIKMADGGTPALNWGQWAGVGGPPESPFINALAVNGTSIYAAGESLVSTSWETVAFQGAHSGENEGFVVKVVDDGGPPTLTWGQWFGGNGSENFNALAINGSSIYVGGNSTRSTSWETVTFQGVHTGTSEAFVVKMTDGGTPALNWGQWLGGNSSNSLNAIVVNGSAIFAGGESSGSTSFETLTFQGVHSGSSEGYVVKITDGGTPTLNWGQWLGGSSGENLNALSATGSSIFSGGRSSASASWETVTFQGVHNGAGEGFVVKITDGGTPSLNWGQWVGGNDDTEVFSLAVSGTTIYAGGYSDETTNFETLAFQGVFSNPGFEYEGFVIKISDGGTPSLKWGYWLGGDGYDAVYKITTDGTSVYAGGESENSTSWETLTFEGTMLGDDAMVVKIADGGTPSLEWGQWLSAGGNEHVNGLAVNGSRIYAGGQATSTSGGSFQTISFQGSVEGFRTAYVVKMTAAVASTTNAIYFDTAF